jgi:hypothetical protein
MKRITAIACLVAFGATGCVGLKTHGRDGVTVYDPTYYLAVAGTGASQSIDMFVGPDLTSSYAISGERAFFMKNEFALELTDGMVKNASAKYDTTSLLSFFEEAAKMTAGAAGIPAGGAKSGLSGFQMDLGLTSGLYKFDLQTGNLVKVFKKGDAQP